MFACAAITVPSAVAKLSKIPHFLRKIPHLKQKPFLQLFIGLLIIIREVYTLHKNLTVVNLDCLQININYRF